MLYPFINSKWLENSDILSFFPHCFTSWTTSIMRNISFSIISFPSSIIHTEKAGEILNSFPLLASFRNNSIISIFQWQTIRVFFFFSLFYLCKLMDLNLFGVLLNAVITDAWSVSASASKSVLELALQYLTWLQSSLIASLPSGMTGWSSRILYISCPRSGWSPFLNYIIQSF